MCQRPPNAREYPRRFSSTPRAQLLNSMHKRFRRAGNSCNEKDVLLLTEQREALCEPRSQLSLCLQQRRCHSRRTAIAIVPTYALWTILETRWSLRMVIVWRICIGGRCESFTRATAVISKSPKPCSGTSRSRSRTSDGLSHSE